MIKNKPLISVLIPTYNREKYIKEALDSLYIQNYDNIEIIVVDDGSTDNTKEILKEYKDIRYFYIEHKGIPFARNLALEKSRGEYIAFLDSDDYWLEGKLNAQINYLQEHKDCSIVFTRYKNFYDNGYVKNDKETREDNVISENKYGLHTSLIKKNLFIKYGNFDENFQTGEDSEFVYRLNENGINTKNIINEVFYMRRLHGNNITLSDIGVDRRKNLISILRKGIMKK